MDTNTALTPLAATLPAPAGSRSHLIAPAMRRTRLVALTAPEAITHPRVIQALARHAARGDRLGLIIGHNRFALYDLTRAACQHGFAPEAFLAQIELSRAFTCYQLHHCVLSLDASAVERWSALYVLGLLDTFYDESVLSLEAARLLQEILLHLRALVLQGLAILITASPPKQPGREQLLKLLTQVDEYVEFRPDPVSPYGGPRQLALRL